MTDGERLDALQLRAMGIDHAFIDDDDELVTIVEMLLDLGVDLEEMAGTELMFLVAPRMIRPDATIDPAKAFRNDFEAADFRAKAGVALGFNIDDDTRLLTPGEVETVTFFNEMRGLLGDDDVLALQRVMGSAMARVARSVISALRLHVETPIIEQTGSMAEVFNAYRNINDDMLVPFLEAASNVLRRHLAVAASMPTPWDVDRSGAATMEQLTVGFVDMVGFTSFTEKANLAEFVAALTVFESEANEVIITNGGTLVKLIGDEVMFVAPTPASGVEIARRLAKLPLAGGGPGSVRIGLASGQVVAVGGDYYGTVVNTASRAVRHADPDAIVATAEVANGAHASARFISIGPRELRGISEPVELFQLSGPTKL